MTLDVSMLHTQWLPSPASGGWRTTEFFFRYLNIFFLRQLSTGVMDITGGTVLGDDAIFYFMHFFSGMLFILSLPSPTEIHDHFNALILLLDPYTSNNSESKELTFDSVVGASHTQCHLMSSQLPWPRYYLSSLICKSRNKTRGLGQMGVLPEVTELVNGRGGDQNPKPDFPASHPPWPSLGQAAVCLLLLISPAAKPSTPAHPPRLGCWGKSVPCIQEKPHKLIK